MKKSLKIIGPRCGKDEEGYENEDYEEQGSLSLRSKRGGFKSYFPLRVRRILMFCLTGRHLAASGDILGCYN